MAAGWVPRLFLPLCPPPSAPLLSKPSRALQDPADFEPAFPVERARRTEVPEDGLCGFYCIAGELLRLGIVDRLLDPAALLPHLAALLHSHWDAGFTHVSGNLREPVRFQGTLGSFLQQELRLTSAQEYLDQRLAPPAPEPEPPPGQGQRRRGRASETAGRLAAGQSHYASDLEFAILCVAANRPVVMVFDERDMRARRTGRRKRARTDRAAGPGDGGPPSSDDQYRVWYRLFPGHVDEQEGGGALPPTTEEDPHFVYQHGFAPGWGEEPHFSGLQVLAALADAAGEGDQVAVTPAFGARCADAAALCRAMAA
ncbi:MAG: hypothetical protein AAFS07_19165, partial [Pseudomonadota bacterium]